MERISSASNRDRQGNKREVEFYIQNGVVVQRIKKNGRVTHDIKYSGEIFEEVAESIIDTQAELHDQQGKQGLPFDLRQVEASPQKKLDMINQLLGSMSQHELEQLKTQDNSQQINTELLGDIARTPNPKKDAEKIKEDVLQLIYEEYGFDWFTMPEFREVYDVNYQKGQAYRWLQKMDDRWLRKDKIPEEEKDGYVQYRYKLSKNARKVVNQFGAFDTKEYPVYKKKCKEYKQG